jgi:hypothetical protein
MYMNVQMPLKKGMVSAKFVHPYTLQPGQKKNCLYVKCSLGAEHQVIAALE